MIATRSPEKIQGRAFSTDQQTLAVGGMGHIQNVDGLVGKARVEWFDLQSGEPSGLFESDSHKGLVESLQYHPSEPCLIAAAVVARDFSCFWTHSPKRPYTKRNHPFMSTRSL